VFPICLVGPWPDQAGATIVGIPDHKASPGIPWLLPPIKCLWEDDWAWKISFPTINTFGMGLQVVPLPIFGKKILSYISMILLGGSKCVTKKQCEKNLEKYWPMENRMAG